MKKLKGQGKITKYLTSKIAVLNRNSFAKFINNSIKLKKLITDCNNDRIIKIEVISFSSSRDFNEQFLSILSFIKYVGTPISWIVYSDGTHNEEQVKQIESAFNFLKLIKIDEIDKYIIKNIREPLYPYQDLLINYAKMFPLGARIFLYLNYPVKYPTLFIDSDIVFYQKAICLHQLIFNDVNGWFLPDADCNNLDSRYIKNNNLQHYQVNGGFFIFNTEITKLSRGLNFLKDLNNKYEYFSDQTALHITLIENKFMPLDPRIFALNSNDQFDFSYLYSRESIAIRHYTGPVRHKMWQRNWKWHLSL